MKNFQIFMFVIFGSLLLSCAPSVGISSGRILSSNSDGHLRRDVSYVVDGVDQRMVLNFYRDGSYLMIMQFPEGFEDLDLDGDIEEEWADLVTYRGPYSYFSDSFDFSLTMSEMKDLSSGSTNWGPADTNAVRDAVIYMKAVMTESTFQPVFVPAENGYWKSVRVDLNEEGGTETNILSYKINADTILCLDTEIVISNSGEFLSYVKRSSYDILSSAPENVSFAEGQSAQYLCSRTFYETYAYTNDRTDVHTNTYTPDAMDTFNFHHFGDFIVDDIELSLGF